MWFNRGNLIILLPIEFLILGESRDDRNYVGKFLNFKTEIMRSNSYLKSLVILAVSSALLFSCNDDDTPELESSATLYTSNNANGNVTTYDITNMSNITSKTFLTTSTMADGVYYDASADIIVQASRSGLLLEGFTGIDGLLTGTALTRDISSTADMQSPRETAVRGNFYVVADNADADGNDATLDGRLFVYERNGTSFTLRNTITTDFKLWGITFIGTDLYAVVDADNELAVFNNFLDNTADATLSASKRIVVEGIVRTHGLTYDASSDIMVMTDIGEASNTQDDGGFHMINNFSSKFAATSNNGTLAVSDQVRVAGAATLLGNPVDVAYDAASSTVFIAEAGNGGGRILAFNNIGTGGNLTPAVNNSLVGASSVFLSAQ